MVVPMLRSNIFLPHRSLKKKSRKHACDFLCSKRDSNPHRRFCPRDFKSLVSTIPPFELLRNGKSRAKLRFALLFWRAENETRTRDPNLGKVVLYQLSYFRVMEIFLSVSFLLLSEEEETRTPTSQLTLPPQSSASTNSATSPS